VTAFREAVSGERMAYFRDPDEHLSHVTARL
jgi:hypothetical protein